MFSNLRFVMHSTCISYLQRHRRLNFHLGAMLSVAALLWSRTSFRLRRHRCFQLLFKIDTIFEIMLVCSFLDKCLKHKCLSYECLRTHCDRVFKWKEKKTNRVVQLLWCCFRLIWKALTVLELVVWGNEKVHINDTMLTKERFVLEFPI